MVLLIDHHEVLTIIIEHSVSNVIQQILVSKVGVMDDVAILVKQLT